MQDKKPLRNSQDYINVSVDRKNHNEIQEYLSKECDGASIGKFYDKAAMERLQRLKEKNSLFSKFNTMTLLSNGWKKDGSSSYKRGNDIVVYTGIHWLFNGEKLTEDNYIDKIYDKSKAKL